MTEFLRASVSRAAELRRSERTRFSVRTRRRSRPGFSRCLRRRSAGGDGGTTLFRSARSDEDGGNLANIAASRASNQQSAMREQKDQRHGLE